MRWLLVCALAYSAFSYADRSPASALVQGELVIHLAEDEWATLPSTSFFNKPTTLLEHRSLPRLRGILSWRNATLKAGQPFNESRRIQELCRNLSKSYETSKSHTVIKAKTALTGQPHCRLLVKEKEALVIEQLLFVHQDKQSAKRVTTHTVTFFYPASDEKRATQAITKFLTSVERNRDGG
jgi:hypothetical protein